MNTTDKLCAQIENTQSIICVGLDPRITIDSSVPTQEQSVYERIMAHNERIIESTHTQCACYKPNIAFYEQWGREGWKALEQTLRIIPSHIPVILDSKRGDIGATAEAYAYSSFQHLEVDSVTLAPYMGVGSISPFLSFEEKLLFVLVRTSNLHAETVQNMEVTGISEDISAGTPASMSGETRALYMEIAAQYAAISEHIGFVVGANCYAELAKIRETYPQRWILAPGIGAQGADLERALSVGLGVQGSYFLPVMARSIAQAEFPDKVCSEYNARINKKTQEMMTTHISVPNTDIRTDLHKEDPISSLTQHIIEGLYQHECIRIGEFTLKSGLLSPFYIDLRRIVSFPTLFSQVIRLYCSIIQALPFDYIAGIPTAGLPFAAAVAMALKKPMIYPRIPKKPHGTHNNIEGAFEPNGRVVLLDDLITKGSSKEEALSLLQESKLISKDIVVLICRSYHATDDMAQLGVNLHYGLHIDDIIDYGQRNSHIDDEQLSQITHFLQTTS